uniref:Uncharacterized protein n=1 Tax=Glossina pallidipes TaxID=7398 RepID=A0A1A9ZZ18_GLOPL
MNIIRVERKKRTRENHCDSRDSKYFKHQMLFSEGEQDVDSLTKQMTTTIGRLRERGHLYYLKVVMSHSISKFFEFLLIVTVIMTLNMKWFWIRYQSKFGQQQQPEVEKFIEKENPLSATRATADAEIEVDATYVAVIVVFVIDKYFDLFCNLSPLFDINKAFTVLFSIEAYVLNQVNSLEKGIMISGQTYDEVRRLKDNVTRERDNLRSDIVELNNQIADLKHTIVIQSNNIDNLHLDINKLNIKLDDAKVNASKAEKGRGEMAQEMETLHEKIEYFQEGLPVKRNDLNHRNSLGSRLVFQKGKT